MSEPIRILYVDDSPLDRELVRDALEIDHGGFKVIQAASRTDFEARLAEGEYDLVLSDFNILGFEGLQVLEMVQERSPATPVVIVTGTGSEEVAAEAIRRGAADYVIKTPAHIRRLPHTIHTAIERCRLDREREHASFERNMLFENSVDMLTISDYAGVIRQASPAWERTMGWEPGELVGRVLAEFVHPDDLPSLAGIGERLLAGEPVDIAEIRWRRKDGEYRWISGSARPWPEADLIFQSARDVTEQKLAEERVETQVQRLAALHNIDKAITGSSELGDVLNTLLRQTIEQLHVDAANILLFDADMHVLELAAGAGFDSDAVRRARTRLSEGYAGRAVAERRVIHVPNLLEAGEATAADAELEQGEIVEYYGAPLVAKGQLKGVLEVFNLTPLSADKDWTVFLEMLAEQAAIAIDSAQLVRSLRQSNEELALAYTATIEGWSRALDLRDKETEGHTQRVTELTLELGRRMGMTETELMHVRRGVLLHDIGKMGVPDSILLKPGSLSEAEWVVMRKHPEYAFNMLSPIDYLRKALDIPYCHHERWDGSGYPRGLRGDEIPLSARIFAIVDVWDALRSDRPYRRAWSDEQARDYIQSQSGGHFDPHVVEVFMRVLSD